MRPATDTDAVLLCADERGPVKKHFIAAAFFWAVLTAAGELLVFADLFPTVGSEEAEEFDRIFRILLAMGWPVFAFVVSVVGYSFFQFRSRGDDSEDGPAMYGRGAVPRVWLGITGGLAVLTMIFPGLTGLAELQSDRGGYGWGDTEGELLVKVEGFRYSWAFQYPDLGVEILGANQELVLPVDTKVKFEVSSLDVVHSFWIPAFRMKIDAIPGRTTFMTVTPTKVGSYDDDQSFRVQCAELCGMDHSVMSFPVRVVEREEFDAWIASQKEEQ